MKLLREWLCRLWGTFRPDARDRELEEELKLHLELAAEDGERKGEAPRAARVRTGGATQALEAMRDQRGLPWVEGLGRDVRHGARSLARNPGFTAVALVTLALGIGANTAIFSIVDRVLLRPLPYPDAEELVLLYESNREASGRRSVSTANWLDWREQSESFESMAAWGAGEFSWQMNLAGEGNAERLNGQFVTEEFFSVLETEPALGRMFVPEDHAQGASGVVVLAHGFWQLRFGSDPGVIGRTITLESIPAEVVGVMPPGFHFVWPDTDFWWPLRSVDRTRDYRANPGNTLNVVGRLKLLVGLAAVRVEMNTIAERLAAAYPENEDRLVTIVPLRDELTGEVRASLWVLFAGVSVLLLIACSNFAGLLLARSASRSAEIRVRAALGAGRGAILRQWLAESLLLTCAGGVAGTIIAYAAVTALADLVPPELVEIGNALPDARILLYALGVSLLTGSLIGLVPAISASRSSLIHALLASGRTTPRSTRLRRGLVMSQIALTVVLLCGSALLARSFRELTRVDLGLDPRDVLTLTVGLDGEPYDSRGQEYVDFYRQVSERLGGLPGVRSAGAAQDIPVTGGVVSNEVPFRIQGTPQLPSSELPTVYLRMVTPGYFRTLGIPLVGGRDFSIDDRPDDPDAFIVSQSFVDRFLSGRDPLTTSIALSDNPYGRIVGVVGNVKEDSLRGQTQPTVFFTYSQVATSTDMIVFLRADNAETLAPAAVAAIQEIDPDVPVYQIRLLEAVFGESIARDRLNAVLSGAFALTALSLAAFGVYGLLSYLVSERTREIGIRTALGARTSEVSRMVLGHTLWLVIPGLVAGLAGALALTRLIEGLLYGVASRDPATFAAVVGLTVAVGAIAALVPARRAARVDPLTALRQE